MTVPDNGKLEGGKPSGETQKAVHHVPRPNWEPMTILETSSKEAAK